MTAIAMLALSAAGLIAGTAALEAQEQRSATAATTARTGSAQAAPAGNVENGKRLFTAYGCYQCHGYAAQGGSAGARLAPRPIAFSAFSRYVRLPTRQMPPYTSKVLSDRELADIFAFVSSISPAPPVNSIPLLSRE